MAFSIKATMKGYEVRGVSTKTSKSGNPFRLMRLEDQEGYTTEVSCTRPELFGSVDALRKGNVINVDVLAVSNQKMNFVSITDAPVLVVADASEMGY